MMSRPDKAGLWGMAGLILAIVISVGLAAFHGYHKEYFYEDEVLSYTLSNSRHGAYFQLRPGEWYRGEDLLAYTYVEKGHGFDFANTIANQQEDTHPPIYALLLHAVCSFAPGHFSKWAGLGLNLVCYILVIILLYLTCLFLFPDHPLYGIPVCLVFGMTAGIAALAVFIRMYILLMVLTMLCLLWHLKVIRSGGGVKMYMALILLTYAGVMTHYFYLFFAFFCAAFLCVYLLIKKNFREVILYAVSMAISAALILITWNRVIWQMFTEETAGDALSQEMNAKVILSKILHMAKAADGELFGDRLAYLALITVIFAVYLAVKDRAALKRTVFVSPEISFTVFTSVCFFVTVSAVTPYPSTRYVSPAYPLFLLLAVVTLKQVSDTTFRSPLLGLAVIILFMAAPELRILQNGLTDRNRQIISEISYEHRDDVCFFGAGIPPEENVFELERFDRIYVYDGKNAAGAAEDIKEPDRIVFYVPSGKEPEEYAKDILAVYPDLKNMERLYVAYYSTCYMLSRGE